MIRQRQHGSGVGPVWRFSCTVLAALAGAIFLSQSPLHADLYYEQVSTLTPVGPEQTGTSTLKLKVYVRHGMVRAEDVTSGKIIVFRLDKGLLWGINEADKTYTELTVKQLADDWRKAQRTAGIGDDPKPDIRVEQADREEAVCGYPCKKTTLFAGDEPLMHIWSTSAIDVPEKADLYDYVHCLGKFPKALLDKARSLPGFPLRMRATETIGAGKVEAFREVVLIKFDPVDPKLFELPDGFNKVEIK